MVGYVVVLAVGAFLGRVSRGVDQPSPDDGTVERALRAVQVAQSQKDPGLERLAWVVAECAEDLERIKAEGGYTKGPAVNPRAGVTMPLKGKVS